LRITFWKGVFCAEHSTLDEAKLLKSRGFELHEPTMCDRSTGCRACRAGIGRRYWSPRVEDAARLRSYCTPRGLAALAPHLRRLAQSRATDANVEIPAPPGLAYEGYQKAGIAYALQHKDTLFGDEMGVGKDQPLDAKILTPSGFITMGSVRLGNLVIGSDGLAYPVTGIYPQGMKPVFRVTFQDGSSTECGEHHLWEVNTACRKNARQPPRVLTTRQIIDAGLALKNGNRLHYVRLALPFSHPEREHLIHPYVMGYLLGNGGLSQSSVRVTIPDQESVSRIENFLPTEYYLSQQQTEIAYIVARRDGHRHSNQVLHEMQRLGLMKHLSCEKFIPPEYTLDSTRNRIFLLQGLVDSDGHVQPQNGNVEYTSSSHKLARDVQKLVWSLGGVAKVQPRKTKCLPSYRMSVQLPNDISPCLLQRKLANVRPRTKYHPCRSITKIESVGVKETQCISVASPDHLYVTDDYVLTHNTVESLGFVNHTRPRSVLVICPATLVYNWRAEILKWLVDPYEVWIPETSEEVPDLRTLDHRLVVVTNYEKVCGRTVKGEYRTTALSRSVLQEWDLGIFDEAHYLKNPEALRSRAVLSENGIYDHVKRALFLTGTPMENRHREIWPLASRLCPRVFGDRHQFETRYCGLHLEQRGDRKVYVADGSTRPAELQQKLRSTFMIRRLRKDVLKELPPKRRQLFVLDEQVDWTKYPELAKWQDTLGQDYEDALEELEVEACRSAEAYAQAVRKLDAIAVEFTRVSDVRHKTGLLKLPACLRFSDTLLECGADCISIFAHHRDVIQKIHEHYGERACVIHGDTPKKKRFEIVQEFQTGKYQVFVGELRAAGTGITLTRASTSVFFETDWNPATVNQAEDRHCRYGQKKMVQIFHPVLDGSIDANMVKKMLAKQTAIDKALDHLPESERMKQVSLPLASP
jgi:hypothetical protein